MQPQSNKNCSWNTTIVTPLATYETITKTQRMKKETLLERVNPGVTEGGESWLFATAAGGQKNAAWVA